MDKKQTISYIRSCVARDRAVTVQYVFDSLEKLPAVIRLHGIDDFIDVPLDAYFSKLKTIKGDDVLTIGRLPLCDIQADDYEDNLISRVHVIWQKVGEKYLLINCGIFGTTAFMKTDDGLEEIPAVNEPWPDFNEA